MKGSSRGPEESGETVRNICQTFELKRCSTPVVGLNISMLLNWLSPISSPGSLLGEIIRGCAVKPSRV